MELRVVDLFCGLRGWSRPFQERGHRVVGLDHDPSFGAEMTVDVLTTTAADIEEALGGRADVVLASPPCETFSVASLGYHWTGGRRAYVPKTPAAERGQAIARKAVELIHALEPRFAVIENPRGVLRRLDIVPGEPTTVWYCHYGESRAKPTDLWGLPFPQSLKLEPACHANRGTHPEACCCKDHEPAPRGAKTGTQGLTTAADRGVIPYMLASAVADAVERDFE